jgi:hypothetical protein
MREQTGEQLPLAGAARVLRTGADRRNGEFRLLFNAILHWNDGPADSVTASVPTAVR